MNVIAKKVLKKPNVTSKKSIKKPSHFFLRVLSRHPSTSGIRNKILIPKVKVVYRHGSTTSGSFEYEINSVLSVKNSADKLLMKQCFDKAEINHAPWYHLESIGVTSDWNNFLNKIGFGKGKEVYLIAKQRWGSRGTGEIKN